MVVVVVDGGWWWGVEAARADASSDSCRPVVLQLPP